MRYCFFLTSTTTYGGFLDLFLFFQIHLPIPHSTLRSSTSNRSFLSIEWNESPPHMEFTCHFWQYRISYYTRFSERRSGPTKPFFGVIVRLNHDQNGHKRVGCRVCQLMNESYSKLCGIAENGIVFPPVGVKRGTRS
jgi:hypothetical protein